MSFFLVQLFLLCWVLAFWHGIDSFGMAFIGNWNGLFHVSQKDIYSLLRFFCYDCLWRCILELVRCGNLMMSFYHSWIFSKSKYVLILVKVARPMFYILEAPICLHRCVRTVPRLSNSSQKNRLLALFNSRNTFSITILAPIKWISYSNFSFPHYALYNTFCTTPSEPVNHPKYYQLTSPT